MQFKAIQKFSKSLLFILSLAMGSMGCAGYNPPLTAEEYDPEHHQDHKIDVLTQDQAIELYQMMKDTHEVFTQCGVQYWLEGGSVLGAIRSKGLVPWDDDNDIEVPEAERAKIELLRPILSDLGYFVETTFFGYRIVKKQKTSGQVDIFMMTEINGDFFPKGDWGTRTVTDASGKTETKPIFVKREEVFPLQVVDFGPIKVNIAHDPYPYLNSLFKGWEDVAFVYGHAGQRKFKIDLKKFPQFKGAAPLDPKTEASIDVSPSMENRVPKDLKCPSGGGSSLINMPLPSGII